MICNPCKQAADNNIPHGYCWGIVVHKTHCDCQHKRIEKNAQRETQRDNETQESIRSGK